MGPKGGALSCVLSVVLAMGLVACSSSPPQGSSDPPEGGHYFLSSQDRNHPSSGISFHAWIENHCGPGCGISAAAQIRVRVTVESSPNGEVVLETNVPTDKPNWHAIPPGSYVVRSEPLEIAERCPTTNPIALERDVTLTIDLYCE